MAAGYAQTMAPSLQPVALEVVRRAGLRPHERVLDVGTGTGQAAAQAMGEGRSVSGIDLAAGMLEIARREVPGASFREMDFEATTFGDGAFDVVIAVHALHFAGDAAGALREWRRVTRPDGRLSLSVPGPAAVSPEAVYREIYARHGIATGQRYPERASLMEMAGAAGWSDVATDADPDHAITLPDDEAFRVWRSIGSRGAATAGWSQERQDALTEEMLAATARAADGSLRIPFGVLYLSAHA